MAVLRIHITHFVGCLVLWTMLHRRYGRTGKLLPLAMAAQSRPVCPSSHSAVWDCRRWPAIVRIEPVHFPRERSDRFHLPLSFPRALLFWTQQRELPSKMPRAG